MQLVESGNLTNACNDYQACFFAGYSSEVGNLTNACNGVNACQYAGNSDGVVGNLKNCCNDYKACSNFENDADIPVACHLTESLF